MGEEPAPPPEPFEFAEALWLHAYQTLAARLSTPTRRPPRPPDLPGLPPEPSYPAWPAEPSQSSQRSHPDDAVGPDEPRGPDGAAEARPDPAAPAPEPDEEAGRSYLVPFRPPRPTLPGTYSGGELPGIPARPAELPDLRDAAEISRALRPLKRLVPSASELELDEEATAEHAAEAGVFVPYTRPVDERLFDLVLVVDDYSTMLVWQQTIAEFTALVERVGAFRDVRTRHLGLRGGDDDQRREAALRGALPGDAYLGAPAELLDPTGRRIILVLTDGLGPLWRTEAGRNALALWSGAGPVAVAHLLSQRDWHRTALAPRQLQLRGPRAGARNTELAVAFPADRYDPFDPPPETWTAPVPVLELDAEWLGWWARLVGGESPGWVDASALLLGAPEPAGPEDLSDDLDAAPEDGAGPLPAPSVRERIRRFRSQASPTAFRLATYLAAAPLEPRMVRTVQRRLLPDSRPAHLAELFLSGLLERTPPNDSLGPAADIQVDFVSGAREELLSNAMRSETARVVRSVSDFYGDRVDAARELGSALLAPEEVPDPAVTPETLPFVRVELAVLRALSGPYLRRAGRISAALEGALPTGSGPLQSDAGMGNFPRSAPIVHDDLNELNVDINNDTDGLTMTDTTASQQRQDPQRATEPPAPPPAVQAPDQPPAAGLSPFHTPPAGVPVQGVRGSHLAVPAVWGNVPPSNPNFTGREELLTQVQEQLATGETSAVLPHTLHGMGGVGKSQIAIEYVYRHAADYDVVWWIPSEQPAMILTALTELAVRLGLQVTGEANTAVPAVREALRSGIPYRNWLLVFDNAENVEAVRPYFPTGGTGKILVTSRNQEWDRVARTLSVDVFTREESKTLLRRRARDLSDADADLLAAALGDLPLAIEQAAAWQAVTGMAVPEYLGLIREKIAELMLELVPSPDYPMSVAAAWDVSLRRLEERNPAALQLLQVCSFFAPEPISRSLFNNSRTTTIAPELDEALRDPIKLGRAIREINIYALARIEHRHDTLQLHRLVQAVLVNRMSPQQQADMKHGAHLLLADANPNAPSSREFWPRYQALLPHVVVSRAMECDSPWVLRLVQGMVEFLYSWGDHAGARDMAREAFELWTVKFGSDDRQTLEMAKWLAFLLRTVGEFEEATAMMQRTADRYLRVAGEDDEGTLDALMQHCGGLRIKGEFQRALDINRSVYERSVRAFGEDDPSTLRAAHSLGVGLRLMGLFEEALGYDVENARQRALHLGENHFDTLNTLSALAIDMRESGDYLGAAVHQEGTYARYIESFGPDTPASVNAGRVLGVCRRRAGDHQGALELSEMGTATFEARYGPDHPDAIACAADLVVDLRQSGQLRRSREIGEATVKRYQGKLGAGHPYTLSARTNLAITLLHLSDLDAVEEHITAALSGFNASVGDEHVLTLTATIGLANHRDAAGRHDEALELDEQALEILGRTQGQDHPITLACANNLALDLRALGREAEADALHTDTLTRFRRTLGEAHPATVAAASSERAEVDITPAPF